MKKKGKFIVFEGIDGSGKTTQAKALAEYLEARGHRVHLTAEPTSLPTGKLLREALGGKIKKSECEMALMFVEDRIAHNKDAAEGIDALLDAGVTVICDRYYYSTLAYQGQSTDYAWVKEMNLSCPEIRTPDVCFFLDLTPAQSMARINRGRLTQEIYENEEKLESVRQSFYRVFEELKGERIEIIDAYRSVEEIHGEILEKTLSLLEF